MQGKARKEGKTEKMKKEKGEEKKDKTEETNICKGANYARVLLNAYLDFSPIDLHPPIHTTYSNPGFMSSLRSARKWGLREKRQAKQQAGVLLYIHQCSFFSRGCTSCAFAPWLRERFLRPPIPWWPRLFPMLGPWRSQGIGSTTFE